MTQETMLAAAATTLATQIIDYVAYNQWANERITGWLRTKPDEILEQEVPSSFPTIKETLLHIRRTEQYWLGHLKGVKCKPVYDEVFEGTAEDLFEDVNIQSEAFYDHVQSLNEKTVRESCCFLAPVRWPEWDEFVRPVSELIMHAMNHSTYHRGQIITIGRNLGLTDAPMTDYMYYLLMEKD
ncbi:DinB family protein [Chitinophagaceae bacterium MMS25-I14]